LVSVNGSPIGHVGELSPASASALDIDSRVALAEVDLAPLLAPVQPVLSLSPSVFPHVDFDLSFLVSADTASADLVAVTIGAAPDLVEAARVFDEFRDESLGRDRKALAITYRLRAADRTLEAKEIASIRQAMIDAAAGMDAQLRGV
jgi:phenylalanyl-tRNA synthetase beta chain